MLPGESLYAIMDARTYSRARVSVRGYGLLSARPRRAKMSRGSRSGPKLPFSHRAMHRSKLPGEVMLVDLKVNRRLRMWRYGVSHSS
jgi:hypothetical protein